MDCDNSYAAAICMFAAFVFPALYALVHICDERVYAKRRKAADEMRGYIPPISREFSKFENDCVAHGVDYALTQDIIQMILRNLKICGCRTKASVNMTFDFTLDDIEEKYGGSPLEAQAMELFQNNRELWQSLIRTDD